MMCIIWLFCIYLHSHVIMTMIEVTDNPSPPKFVGVFLYLCLFVLFCIFVVRHMWATCLTPLKVTAMVNYRTMLSSRSLELPHLGYLKLHTRLTQLSSPHRAPGSQPSWVYCYTWLFYITSARGVMQCLPSCVWLVSLSMMSPQSVHVAVCVRTSFLFKAGYQSIVCIDHISNGVLRMPVSLCFDQRLKVTVT